MSAVPGFLCDLVSLAVINPVKEAVVISRFIVFVHLFWHC